MGRLPAPEPREPLQANPTDSLLSRLADPGLILPIHTRRAILHCLSEEPSLWK
jgi:DNA-binding transcriptional ArsR family regulator